MYPKEKRSNPDALHNIIAKARAKQRKKAAAPYASADRHRDLIAEFRAMFAPAYNDISDSQIFYSMTYKAYLSSKGYGHRTHATRK